METRTHNIIRMEEIMGRTRLSRSKRLLNHMIQGRTVNGRQALTRFGIYRLSSIIHNWRKKGFDIETTMRTRGGNTYAVYTMKGTPNV